MIKQTLGNHSPKGNSQWLNSARQTLFDELSHVITPLDMWDNLKESGYYGNTKVF